MRQQAFHRLLAAPYLGKIADKTGAEHVLCVALLVAAVISLPQAFVTAGWQLIVLRFLMGIPIGAMLPMVHTLLRKQAAPTIAGRIFSLNQAIQAIGFFSGSFLWGQLVAHVGIRSVFLVVTVVLLCNALWVYRQICTPVKA